MSEKLSIAVIWFVLLLPIPMIVWTWFKLLTQTAGRIPRTPTCEIVEVVAGQRHEVKLTIDPLKLTTEFIPPPRNCSPESEVGGQ